jgi:hypothetical protein
MDRWEQRKLQSWLIRGAAFVLPIAAAVITATVLTRTLPAPRDGWLHAGWWLAVIGGAVVAMVVVTRLARRLLPLSALLHLSLAFPGTAPSRYRIALRAWSSGSVAREVEAAKSAGAHTEATRAAETLLTLLAALGSHDSKTRGHAERTRAYADVIATELGLSDGDRDRLRWVSLLHDIGKLVVPTEVLGKDAPLDQSDWDHLQHHPEIGYELVRPLHEFLGGWEEAILHHHERYNGTGYPAGLRGSEISFGARIVSVADAFDAMTSARSYKRPMTAAQARKELAYRAGEQFDPTVVRAFLNVSTSTMHRLVGPLGALASLSVVRWLRPVTRTTGSAAVAAMSIAVMAAAGAVELPETPAAEAIVLGEEIEAPGIVIGGGPGVVSLEVLGSPPGIETASNDDGTVTVRAPAGYQGSLNLEVRTCDAAGQCEVHDVEVAVGADGIPALLAAGPGITARSAGRAEAGAGTSATTMTTTTVPPTTTTPTTTTVPPTTTTPTTTTVPPTTTTVAPATTTTTTTTTTVPPTTTTVPPTTTTTVPPTTTTTVPPTTTTTVPNAAPVASDDLATTEEDVAVLIDVTANDTDEDPASLVVTVHSQPSAGTAVVQDGRILFTPEADDNGSRNFDYEICDAAGECDRGRVDVTISAVNDAPVASADTAETSMGQPVTVKVVDNDTDVDGDQLLVGAFDTTSTLGGTVDCTLKNSTECDYSPPTDWDGTTDSFGYTVIDGNGGSATAIVTITLKP